MLHLALKQAEAAITAGRLDEAFSIVRCREHRSTRTGQTLLSRLTDALIERGREHLTAGRIGPAGSDAAKAIECAGRQPAAVELFDAVAAARHDQDKRRHRTDQIVAHANQQIAHGEVSLAGRIVDSSDLNSSAAQGIADQISQQRVVAAAALEKIAQVRNDLRDGRLDRAEAATRRFAPLRRWSPEIDECVDIMDRCRRLQTKIRTCRFAEAQVEVALLMRLLPDARWLADVSTQLQSALEATNSLRSGALGLLATGAAATTADADDSHSSDLLFQPDSIRSAGELPLPACLLMQADGISSLLLWTADRITIGGRTRGREINLSLITDGSVSPFTIDRDDSDYLLSSRTPIEINGRAVSKRLLEDGDRIAIGRRGRLRFRRRLSASSTALLELESTSMSRGDVRQIVLFGDSLMLGPASSSHLAMRGGRSPVMLYREAGGLAVRTFSDKDSRPVVIGESMVLDDCRIAVHEFEV